MLTKNCFAEDTFNKDLPKISSMFSLSHPLRKGYTILFDGGIFPVIYYYILYKKQIFFYRYFFNFTYNFYYEPVRICIEIVTYYG